MIKYFETETAPLNKKEMMIASLVESLLKNKLGEENAITSKEIISSLSHIGYKVSDTRIRKIINYIRTHNVVPCLMASNIGYYISNNIEEIKGYLISLKGRENAIANVRVSLEAQLRELSNQSVAA